MMVEFGPKCLLITGPSGCGKSATVKVICNELGVEVIEFDGSEYELSTLGDIWERPNSKVFQGKSIYTEIALQREVEFAVFRFCAECRIILDRESRQKVSPAPHRTTTKQFLQVCASTMTLRS